MNKVSAILKTLIAGYVITVVALLVLSFILYKFRVSDGVITIGIYVIYGISTFFGGLMLAKKLVRNRLVWGALYGLMYFIILCTISVIMSKGVDTDIAEILKSAVLCVLCGAVGGILS